MILFLQMCFYKNAKLRHSHGGFLCHVHILKDYLFFLFLLTAGRVYFLLVTAGRVYNYAIVFIKNNIRITTFTLLSINAYADL